MLGHVAAAACPSDWDIAAKEACCFANDAGTAAAAGEEELTLDMPSVADCRELQRKDLACQVHCQTVRHQADVKVPLRHLGQLPSAVSFPVCQKMVAVFDWK